jgi:hypothetical protein
LSGCGQHRCRVSLAHFWYGSIRIPKTLRA